MPNIKLVNIFKKTRYTMLMRLLNDYLMLKGRDLVFPKNNKTTQDSL